MPQALHPVTLLVGGSSADPIEVLVEGYGLRMVVVNKTSLRLLSDDWTVPGVYILLGRPEDPERYTAYVGKAATQGLRQRVSQHVRTAKTWDRALLITGDAFDSGAVSYLEGRFYDVLKNAAAADVLNGQEPRDETLQPYRRAILDRYAEPVTLAMRALGCPPDTADQAPPRPLRERRVFTESVKDLLDAGLLRPGTRLRPTGRKHDEPATVLADGTLEVDGRRHGSVSAAASAVSGNKAEAGWSFWASPSGDGTMVSLSALRDRLREGGRAIPGSGESIDPPPPEVGRATSHAEAVAPTPAASGEPVGRTSRRYNVTLKELLDDGQLFPGEPLTLLRKRPEDVEGTLNADGSIDVQGETYASPSSAAQAVTGAKAEPGWGIWGVHRDGKVQRLADVRAAYLNSREATT